jgi:hypothetical protein
MADVDAPPPGRGSGGSNLLLVLLVVVVLGLVIWLVMSRRGGDAEVDVNVPTVETTNVEVRSSGDGK